MTDPIYSLTRFLNEPMAIAENHWEAIFGRSQSFLEKIEAGQIQFPLGDEEKDREERFNPTDYRVDDSGQATLYITGIIGKRLDRWMARWMGMTDLDVLQERLRHSEENEEVKSVRLIIDSPGGAVTGVEETMRQVANFSKPITAVTDTIMASAAYFIASQCTRIECTRSASIGSIGVVYGRYDWSRHYKEERKADPVIFRSGDLKAPGYLPGEALTEKQRGDYQARVDATFQAHDKLLFQSRPYIAPEYKQGQILRGADAWPVGMVDDLVGGIG